MEGKARRREVAEDAVDDSTAGNVAAAVVVGKGNLAVDSAGRRGASTDAVAEAVDESATAHVPWTRAWVVEEA